MRALALTLAAALAAPVGAAPRPAPGARPAITFAALRAGFRQPDLRYAPFAFWFWDSPLARARPADMAREMARQRLNPGYAHGRMAMTPGAPSLPREEWLSPRWLSEFGAALGEASRAGAYLGYCDEYWWPSGQAAGRVAALHPELRPLSVRARVIDVAGGERVGLPESLFTVAARHAAPFDASRSDAAALAPLGAWIWSASGASESSRAWFRKTFTLEPGRPIVSARLRGTADNQVVLLINGAEAARGADWTRIQDADVRRLLRPGLNVVAVEAANLDGPAGMTASLRVRFADGRMLDIATGADWRASAAAAAGWEHPAFDDGAWQAATLVGAAGGPPWRLNDEPARVPARIRSATLRVIGAGRSFGWRAPAGAWRVYSFTTYEHPGLDGGGVNYLDARLGSVFIGLAHEPYARRFGGQMGRRIPGVFVDNEGDYGWKLAWAPDLPAAYRRRTGRDLRQWLPLMLDEDAEGRWARARWDWFEAVSDLYSGRFLGGVSRWLAARGMYCVSNLWEETLMLQASAVGDFFKAQRAVTMPGTDCLGRKALEVHDFKESASVAEFEGRRLQTELMGVAGWDATPVLMKQAVNATTAWGVSHIVPHGIFMTRTFDGNPWPPDWFTENPYWPYLHLWTDFSRRACWVSSHGQAAPDVLLLNPMDSIWALMDESMLDAGYPGVPAGGARREELLRIDRVYSDAIAGLTAARVEYLIADRHYVRRMAVRGAALALGDLRFRAVVLPPMRILPRDVAAKLVVFARAGGRVYALGDLPVGSTDEGMNDPAMRATMARLAALPSFVRCRALAEALAGPNALPRQVRFLSGTFPMLQSHRRVAGRDLYWLANNTGESRSCRLAVRGARGACEAWDCESGAVRPIASRERGGGSEVSLRFGPVEGFWLVFDASRRATTQAAARELATVATAISGPWTWRVDARAQPPVPHRAAIPDALARREGSSLPLESWNRHGLERFTGYVDYTAEWTQPASRGGAVLDLGHVEHMAEVWVNGRRVGARLWPPYVFDVGAALRPGPNAVRVRVGNLMSNCMGQVREAGLFGPVVVRREPDHGP